VAGFYRYRLAEANQLPVLGSLTEFDLVNERSENFGLGNLAGKVWVADFIFTSCAGPCPLMSQRMAALQRTFRPQPQFRLVSFSVDPEYDTPEVLSDYGRQYGAARDRWTFLTGSPADIQDVTVNGFHLGSVEEPIYHSTLFTLVDGQGRIRGYYDSNDAQTLESLVDHIQLLLTTL
ncbi:MAG: SCO family protein, partial [Candidatus Marinimicrobia bacterium]|nr:SCO family protein [Candidatus Neomarinimicrobiota bacterium]